MCKGKDLAFIIFLIAALYSFFPVLKETYKYLNSLLIAFAAAFYIFSSIIKGKKFKFRQSDIRVYFILLFWLCYSLASSIWTYELKLGLLGTFRIFSMLLSFYITVQILDSLKKTVQFSYFLIGIFFLYLLIAFWEITTFNHLPSSRHGVEGIKSFIPYGPFYNRNDMAAILLMLLPFPYFFMLKTRSVALKILIFSSIIFLGISITLAGARLAMIFYALSLLIFLLFYTPIRLKVYFMLAIILVVFAFSRWQPVYFSFFRKYMQGEISSLQKGKQSYRDGSIGIRWKLIKEGVKLGIESNYLGIGSGNIPNTMARDSFKRTQNILIPHNFIIEVFAAYGIVITLMILYMFFRWFFALLGIIRRKTGDLYLTRASLFSLLLFIPASILPSSIMHYNFYWIVFAFYHQLINHLEEQHNDAGNPA